MKVAVAGVGNMGQALVEAFIKGSAHKPDEIFLYDTISQKAHDLASKTGCIVPSSLQEAITDANVVLLAVKPQIMRDVVNQFKGYLTPDVLVISIAAGITTKSLREMLSTPNIPIVRVMPNMPAIIGLGASALCFSKVSEESKRYAIKLFETCGLAVEIDEEKMDIVTGISGSGPAYVMLFIDAMADAGVKMGLDRDIAVQLASMTLKGAAGMVLETDKSLTQIINQVCSPGGTTIEAVNVLEKGGFKSIVTEAVIAAAKRSKELSK